MKKTILTIFILGVCATCYALNVGERTSFNSGIIVGGNTGFQPGSTAPITGDWILDTNFWADIGVWKNTSTWND